MTDDSWQQKLGNGSLFNLSWILIVGSHSALIASAIVLLHIVVHMWWLGRGVPELVYIAGVTALGALIDQLLFGLGVFTVNGVSAMAPLWLTCLWPVLATTMGHAFGGLATRPLLAAALGAAGGSASYIAGTRLSDVAFAEPVTGPIIMGVLWAVLFPLLAYGAKLALQETDNATGLT